MKKFFSLFTFVLCFILLLPNVASATELKDTSANPVFLSDQEIQQMLYDGSEGRAATPEEFKLVSDTLIANPSLTVSEVLAQLGLEDINVQEEKDFEQRQKTNSDFSTMAVAGGVGFGNVTRNGVQFRAIPHVINFNILNPIDRFDGIIKGYSILPGGNPKYMETFDDVVHVRNAYPGVTRAGEKTAAIVSHYGNYARLEISVVVQDGFTTPFLAFHGMRSNPDGSIKDYEVPGEF